MPRLPALILLFLLLAGAAGAQTLQEKRSGPKAPGDSVKSHVTREFELYAPTDEDLRGANEELHLATSQFVRLLGENPKKMAFVLFRSAADADRFDYKPLARRGIQAVPWILPARSPGGSAPVAGKQEEGGASRVPLSHEAGHRFLIAYAENVIAEAGAARLDASDSGAVNAGPPAGGSPNSSRGGVVPAAPAGRHPDQPALPDWLEEAVAALCERPSLQRNRLDFMRAHLDRRIPFDELLTMRRPSTGEAGGSKSGGTGSTRAAPQSGAAKSAGGAGGASAAGAQRAIFDAEALSLGRFIAYREEGRFLGTIVEGVLRGRMAGDVINTSQNLHSKPEALEKEWLEWMQNPSGAR